MQPRLRYWDPAPQLTEQLDHASQLLHPPDTGQSQSESTLRPAITWAALCVAAVDEGGRAGAGVPAVGRGRVGAGAGPGAAPPVTGAGAGRPALPGAPPARHRAPNRRTVLEKDIMMNGSDPFLGLHLGFSAAAVAGLAAVGGGRFVAAAGAGARPAPAGARAATPLAPPAPGSVHCTGVRPSCRRYWRPMTHPGRPTRCTPDCRLRGRGRGGRRTAGRAGRSGGFGSGWHGSTTSIIVQ